MTKLVLLDTHLQTRGSDETALISKAWRLRAAAVTLAVAVAIAVTGSIVSYLDERSGNEQQRSPAPAASTGPRATVSPGP